MRFIYYIPAEAEEEQQNGIKDYLSSRGVYTGDCTILHSDYSYDDSNYVLGMRNLVSSLNHGDVLYVWDYAALARSLESLHTILLIGTMGVSIIQCLDGTIASNESPESIAIVNAIGIASRIELKVSKIQRRQKYSISQESKVTADKGKRIHTIRERLYEPDKIVVRRYSEKSVLVCGDSRAYKEAIHGIGGLFNPRIDNGRAAWVVSLKKLKKLQEVLAGANYTITQDCYISRDSFSNSESK